MKVPRYSFRTEGGGSVVRIEDTHGEWVCVEAIRGLEKSCAHYERQIEKMEDELEDCKATLRGLKELVRDYKAQEGKARAAKRALWQELDALEESEP